MNIPFILRPSGKDYLWGGTKLIDEWDKVLNVVPLAETWECSINSDAPSYVASGEYEGHTLSKVLDMRPEYLGKKHENGFPVLVKFIDAQKDLSLQVHPDDEYARVHENGQLGKTEMWYVVDAAPGAKIYYGFKEDVDEQTVRAAIESGNLEQYLQKIEVKKGDCFLVKPGIVHAIGAGTLIAEIQENSNLTYRLYDYNRVDKDGKKRELHIDKAIAVMDMKRESTLVRTDEQECTESDEAEVLLCSSKYFEVYKMTVNTKVHDSVGYFTDDMSFKVLLCIDGCGALNYESGSLAFHKGDCVFVSANAGEMTISGEAELLDIRA